MSVLSSGSAGDVTSRKLPSTLTVQRLKGVVKQLFSLEPHLQQLSLRASKDRDGSLPVLLDDDAATLQYYGVSEKVDVYINEAKH